MNQLIQQRIQQLITTKFLKTESEIQAVVLSIDAIERDIQKIHGKSAINQKTIETKQIHILNRIHNTFTSGFLFLKYFNFKTDNSPFAKLNTMKVMKVVNDVDTVTSAEVSTFLNEQEAKQKKVHSKKRNFRKNVSKNKTENKVNVVYK